MIYFTAPGIEGVFCEDCAEALEDIVEVVPSEGTVRCAVCEDVTVPSWDALDSDVQDDLIEWYNMVEADSHDKLLLATLYNKGEFEAGDCGHCGHRFHRGNPDSWDDFQGCHNDEGIGDLCEDCTALLHELERIRGF